jgi:large subunit ribosomal protein L24
MRIKMEDLVEVITGDDRGQRGRVLSVDRRAGKLIVEGINQVYKHVRRSQRNPQGGRLSKEMPIPIGNVQLVCEKCGRPTRIGARYNERGAKERFCKRCGANLGEIAPAKPSYARDK